MSDVRRLHGFLESKNRIAARRAVRVLREGVKRLAVHPEIGRPVEEMAPGFRELPIEFGRGAYVVMYRLEGETVVILGIKHGREAGY